MNSHISSIKRNDLEALDAQLLPWPLETLEEQGLLALGMQVLFKRKACTAETKRNVPLKSQRPQSGEFAVWVDNDEASDDGDDLNDRREDVDEDEDAGSSSSSSSDESSDDSTPSKKRNHVAPELTCDISDEEEDFDAEAFVSARQNHCHAMQCSVGLKSGRSLFPPNGTTKETLQANTLSYVIAGSKSESVFVAGTVLRFFF